MRTIIAAVLCGSCLVFEHAAYADNPVAREIMKLQASAQQLLSIRDFLGPVNRGAQIEASGAGLFILRDVTSMAYAGEFTIRPGAQGSIEIERVNGPATLDDSLAVRLPVLRLYRKARSQEIAALAGSQVLASGSPATSGASLVPAISSLPAEASISGIRFIQSSNSTAISQAKAIFFRDGSGYVRGFRSQPSQPGSMAPVLHMTTTYYTAVKSDGAQVWREAVIEAAGDAQLPVSDLESRCSCPADGDCRQAERWLISAGVHFIERGHQLISAIPPQLLAQLSPAPASSAPASAAAKPSAGRDPHAPSENTPPLQKSPSGTPAEDENSRSP